MIAKEYAVVQQVAELETAYYTFTEPDLREFAQRIEQPLQHRINELAFDIAHQQRQIDGLENQIEQLREALQSLLRCPAIHDVYGDDKDEETHEAERIARKALEGCDV